jgi:prohibitin 2
MASDPRETLRRLQQSLSRVQRSGGGMPGGGAPRGALGGIAGLVLLGGGAVLVNNALFNGMLVHTS